MSDEEDLLQKVRTRFEDLCRVLNMDEEASTEAWKSYENISRTFTLEVGPLSGLLRVVLPVMCAAGGTKRSSPGPAHLEETSSCFCPSSAT